MMQPILTLTVNPALDVSTATERVFSGHKLRCGASRLDPGGGGVNVSRVVQRLGGRTLAVYTAGGPTGEAYRRLIEAERIPTLAVPIQGSTREDFTVDETTTGKQFRFVLQGPELSEPEWRLCLALVADSLPVGGYVVASGSLPPGVPDDFYARVARLARRHDARCIVDASGPALAEALAEGVFLVKPSRRELGLHFGTTLESGESQVEAAAGLVADGSAEHVALTLGGEGAVLASKSGILRLAVPGRGGAQHRRSGRQLPGRLRPPPGAGPHPRGGAPGRRRRRKRHRDHRRHRTLPPGGRGAAGGGTRGPGSGRVMADGEGGTGRGCRTSPSAQPDHYRNHQMSVSAAAVPLIRDESLSRPGSGGVRPGPSRGPHRRTVPRQPSRGLP